MNENVYVCGRCLRHGHTPAGIIHHYNHHGSEWCTECARLVNNEDWLPAYHRVGGWVHGWDAARLHRLTGYAPEQEPTL